jgi:FAD/FMN-containing dehydrogenase
VRAQGGVIWSELNREIAEHGLATTGGAISTTGIAGLTLGGGLGWLMSKYGLAADNVVEIQLVTADGRIVDVTESSDPDLFWALRGGGGNFGIAASFVYRCHPLSTVVGGLIAHPFERAGEMLRFYRDAVAGASDDLTVFAAVVHAPDGSGMKLAAMIAMHTGSADDAERELAPFLEWGPPVMVEVGPMPWQVMNSLLDDGYPRGALNYWVSSFTSGLSDGLFDTMVDRFGVCPSPMSAILLEQFHGEVCRVPPAATAVPHRREGWNLLIPGEWLDPAETEVNVAWVRETHAALRPFLGDGRWLNYLGDDQGRDGVRGAYGPNYDRLVELKRKYDPDNVFHRNQNIEP